MSIFGKLRNTKKAVDEHTPADSLPKPAPYKHIPTHAASDSRACAPPGWRKVEDRKSIQAQRKRRSEMRRSTSGLSVVTTLHRGDNYNANDWTITTIDQRDTRPPMPAMPGSEAMRKLSPLHASELSSVHSYDYITSSESSNSISSRGSSMLEIPPRSPRRPQRAVLRTGYMAHGAEHDSYGVESDTDEKALHLHETGTRLHATDLTPQETGPIQQLAEPHPQELQPRSQPARAMGKAVMTRPLAGQEGHRLSKNSVYNNIHKIPNWRTAEAPSLSTTNPRKDQAAHPLFAPTAKRTVAWDMDFVHNEGSPYPRIAAH